MGTELQPLPSPKAKGVVAFAALSIMLFLPSALRFFDIASSFTPGFAAACILVLGMGAIRLYRPEGGPYFAIILIALVMAIVAQGLGASLRFTIDVGRGISSLGIAILAIITGYQIRAILRQTSDHVLQETVWWISGIFMLIAVLSILGIQPPSASFVKPVFPFSEPSHYALCFAPFIMFLSIRLPVHWRLLWLGIILALAFLLESLSMVVAIVLIAACCLYGPLLVASLLATVVVVSNLDVSYFTDRLDFSIASSNVSTLVYIQGLELIIEAMRRTSGWGIGFQQIGIVPLNVPTTELIYRILRDDANLRDGGFLAAKVIAELGYIGIALIVAYVLIAIKSALILRKLTRQSTSADTHQILALSTIVVAAVEIFVRGVGYFSASLLLLIVMLLFAVPNGYFSEKRKIVRREPS